MVHAAKTDATAPKSTQSKETPEISSESRADNSTNRRGWLVEWGAIVMGSLVALIPLVAGLLPFLDPWRRRPNLPKSRQQGGTGKEGFIRVASLDGLVTGGPPQRFPVIADQIDAWNFTPNQPVGAVFLQRISDAEVLCFNATCPHAGCSVSLEDKLFKCPCHNSAFNLDGKKRTSSSGRENPSPRDMDSLDVDTERLQSNEVWVKFVNFYTGKHEKVAKT